MEGNSKSAVKGKVISYAIMFTVVVAGNIFAYWAIQQWNKPRTEAPKTTA